MEKLERYMLNPCLSENCQQLPVWIAAYGLVVGITQLPRIYIVRGSKCTWATEVWLNNLVKMLNRQRSGKD